MILIISWLPLPGERSVVSGYYMQAQCSQAYRSQLITPSRVYWSEMKLKRLFHWLILQKTCGPQLVGRLLFMVQLTGCLVVWLHLVLLCPQKMCSIVWRCKLFLNKPEFNLSLTWDSEESTDVLTGSKPLTQWESKVWSSGRVQLQWEEEKFQTLGLIDSQQNDGWTVRSVCLSVSALITLWRCEGK